MSLEVAAQRRALLGRVLQDKWHLDALLGTGGMATVFAATHRDGTRGAIKLLHPEYVGVPEIRTRLVREGYLVNRITHPGVVRVIDDDVTEEGWPYLVMELLEGQTLKERWVASGHRLPVGEALRIAEEVLDVLVAAHEVRVFHRDVKPDNIFLGTGGDVRLLDFGIARFKESAMDATQTGAMLGTPAFMAPEQALAHWDDIDGRTDVFALGATLWTVLTNRLLHPCSTVPEALIAAGTKQAQPFLSVVPSAPPALADVIDRAVAFERDSRWSGAAEMRDAIATVRMLLDVDASDFVLGASSPPTRLGSLRAPSVPTSTEIMSQTRRQAASTPAPASDTLQRVALESVPPADPRGSVDATKATPATSATASKTPMRVLLGTAAVASLVAAVYGGRWSVPQTPAPESGRSIVVSAAGQNPGPPGSSTPTEMSQAPESSMRPSPPVAELPILQGSNEAPASAAPRTVTPAARKKAAPFDKSAAIGALQAAALGALHCKRGGPSITVHIAATFENTGKAFAVRSRSANAPEASSAACVIQRIESKRVQIAPFEGQSQEVSTTIFIE